MKFAEKCKIAVAGLCIAATLLTGPVASAQSPAWLEPVALGQSQCLEEENSKTDTVYRTEKGKCYHRNSACSNMKNPIKTTVEQAEKDGLRACKKCC